MSKYLSESNYKKKYNPYLVESPRKLRAEQVKTPEATILNKNPNFNYELEIEYNLVDILDYFQKIKVETDTSISFVTFKQVETSKPINFYFPISIKLARLFDKNDFVSNFKKFFFSDFPKEHVSSVFNKLKIVTTFTPSNAAPKIVFNYHEVLYFRQFVCLFFSTFFDIKLMGCQCYPKNALEIIAWNSGLNMNCISKDCKDYLNINPFFFDSTFVGDCPNTTQQIALTLINAWAQKSVDINVNIVQLVTEKLDAK